MKKLISLISAIIAGFISLFVLITVLPLILLMILIIVSIAAIGIWRRKPYIYIKHIRVDPSGRATDNVELTVYPVDNTHENEENQLRLESKHEDQN